MQPIPGRNRRVAALLASIVLVLSSFGALTAGGELVAGGEASVPASSPELSIPDATIDDGTDSNVTVAYNASNYAPSDIEISVSGPARYSAFADSSTNVSFNRTLDSQSGALNLTIPAGTFGGGNVTLDATLLDSSGPSPVTIATDSGALSVESNVTLASYTVEEPPSVYPGDNVTVNATLENGNGGAAENFTVAVTANGVRKNSTKTEVSAGGTAHVPLNVTLLNQGTYTIAVNDNATTTDVTVEDPIDVVDHHVSKEVANESEDVTVDVTLKNDAGRTQTGYAWLWTDPDEFSDEQVDVPGNSERNATFTVNYTDSGEHTIFTSGNGEMTVFVLEDPDGQPNASLDEVFLPDTLVKDRSSFFFAEVTNDGDASAVENVTLSVNGTVVDHDQVYVDPGETRQAFLEHSFTTEKNYAVEIADESGNAQNETITVRGSVVKSSSISRVSGPGDQDPSISAEYQGGFISLQITNGSQFGFDLSSSPINATTDTVYEINLTVDDYDPRVLVSSGQVDEWTTSNGSTQTETNVSIRVTPAQLVYKTQFEGGYPSGPGEWDAAVRNDAADFGFDAALLMGIGNPRGDFVDADPADLTNMTIATDAQLFDMPTYRSGSDDAEPRLEIPLASPHETVAGGTNDGFYEAFLPAALLDSWGVSDPESELAVDYSASDASLEVTEVDDGALVNLTNFHYSSGTVQIERRSGGGGGGGSGSSSRASRSTIDDETETPEPTSTPSTTETATSTPTPAEAEGTPPSTEPAEATSTPATTTPSTETESPGQPGFGAVVAALAIVVAALLTRRRD